MKYSNKAIPFVQVDNRQALTAVQLAQEPWLADFVSAFPDCFEASDYMNCLFFYPKGDAPQSWLNKQR